MSFETHVSECNKYVKTIVNAPITYDIEVSMTRAAYNLACKHGIRNYFFDVRKVRNIESTVNNYRFVHEDVRHIGFDHTVKIGILIDLHDDTHDFIETAAVGAGFNCKIFTSEALLLEWVQI